MNATYTKNLEGSRILVMRGNALVSQRTKDLVSSNPDSIQGFKADLKQ